MAGGKRPGAGRPVGSTTIPQFRDFVSEADRAEFIEFILATYKGDMRLTTWLGNQLFGKAMQPVGGADGGPIQIEGIEISFKK